MKNYYLISFAALIIASQLVRGSVPLNPVNKLSYWGIEKVDSRSDNLRHYNSIEEVKLNSGNDNVQITLSHFYQYLGDSLGKGWNISTIHGLKFFKYFSLGLVLIGEILPIVMTNYGPRIWYTNSG